MSSDVEEEDAVTIEEYRAKLAREDLVPEGRTREERRMIEALGRTVGLRISSVSIQSAEQADRVIATLMLLRHRIRGRAQSCG